MSKPLNVSGMPAYQEIMEAMTFVPRYNVEPQSPSVRHLEETSGDSTRAFDVALHDDGSLAVTRKVRIGNNELWPDTVEVVKRTDLKITADGLVSYFSRHEESYAPWRIGQIDRTGHFFKAAKIGALLRDVRRGLTSKK